MIDRNRFFTAAQVRGDLDELLAAFGDIHPNPFWSRSRAEFSREFDRVVSLVPPGKGLAEPDFFRTLARQVIAFDDPHCWAFVPGWKEFRDGGGRFFPLELRFENGAARVVGGDPALLDAEILRVNGVPIARLYAKYRPLTGQSDDPYGDEFLARFFRCYLWYFEGWSAKITLRIRSKPADGAKEHAKERDILVDGIDQAAYERRDNGLGAKPALEYAPLAPGVGRIVFRSCVAPAEIRALADPIFQGVRASKVTRLIVDNRQNPGGGDDAWHALLGYLTDKPFGAYSQTRYRISQRLKDLLGETEVRAGYAEGAWESPPGKEFVFPFGPDELVQPAANPLRFAGKWCLLAGRGSFSAGMSFVCAVKAFHLATILGDETGGRVRGFGQWVEVRLPNTGLSVAISTKEFVGAVDVPYRRGVPPDIRVRPGKTAESDPSRDPVVRAAVEFLNRAI